MPGAFGAICDQFLTSNQEILTEAQWEALEAKWISEGKAIECTSSDTVGHTKAEIEQLCSIARCDYQTEQTILEGLQRIENAGERSLK